MFVILKVSEPTYFINTHLASLYLRESGKRTNDDIRILHRALLCFLLDITLNCCCQTIPFHPLFLRRIVLV